MRQPLCAVALLTLACAASAQGVGDSDGAVLAQQPEPRAQGASFSSALAGGQAPLRPIDPVVRPAPPIDLPPEAMGAHAPMPRVELPAYAAGAAAVPEDRGRYALWKGAVIAPTDLPSARSPIVSPDERLSDAMGSMPMAAAPSTADQLFVDVEVQLKSGEQVKDAVADLSRASGFRADPRFPATSLVATPYRFTLWGWLPSGRLDSALRLPSVKRLSASPSPHAAPGRAADEVLIGVRLRAGADPAATVARVRDELASDAGVVWLRTIGYQAVPDSNDLAVIALASVPIRSLSRVLDHPDVLKVAPAPEANAMPAAPSVVPVPAKPARPAPSLWRFFQFAATQSPLLLGLTILLLLASLWRGAGRAARLR